MSCGYKADVALATCGTRYKSNVDLGHCADHRVKKTTDLGHCADHRVKKTTDLGHCADHAKKKPADLQEVEEEALEIPEDYKAFHMLEMNGIDEEFLASAQEKNEP